MPGKKKKDKKAPKETKDQLSVYDRTFFELTINDLNTKIQNLRTHNAKIEEHNEELENKMTQLEEDRSDITSYLNRMLKIKLANIVDLEEKLSELDKVRGNETKNFQQKIKDLESKYKAMHDQLTSEIKLLTGKLNSLEEFRIQKDELMTKFEQQENQLKDQTQKHKDLLGDLERKQIQDRDRLKKEIENRLLQLSNEFVKTNEIRIAAHVQRLVRENIALNNELNCMFFTQRRLQNENDKLLDLDDKRDKVLSSIKSENQNLIQTNGKQLTIIDALTTKYEEILKENTKLSDQLEHKKSNELTEKSLRTEVKQLTRTVTIYEQQNDKIRCECDKHISYLHQFDAEIKRLTNILIHLKTTIVDAIKDHRTDGEDSVSDFMKFDAIKLSKPQRKNVLTELMNILITVEDEDKISRADGQWPPQIDQIISINQMYVKGDVGITPHDKLLNLIRLSRSSFKFKRPTSSTTQSGGDGTDAEQTVDVPPDTAKSSQYLDAIIDLDETAKRRRRYSAVNGNNKGENGDDDENGFGMSSSDEETGAKKKSTSTGGQTGGGAQGDE